jgi:hypothetical protein
MKQARCGSALKKWALYCCFERATLARLHLLEAKAVGTPPRLHEPQLCMAATSLAPYTFIIAPLIMQGGQEDGEVEAGA